MNKTQQLFCTNSVCRCDAFEVEAVEAGRLWQLRQSEGGSRLVASNQPICPRCGMALEAIAEIETLLQSLEA